MRIQKLAAFLVMTVVTSTQVLGDAILNERATQASSLIAANPTVPAGLFDKAFTALVNDAQLAVIGKQFFEQCGSVQHVQQTQTISAFGGKFDMVMEKGQVVSMTITISDKVPHQIVGLFFGMPSPMLKTMDDAVAALKKLGSGVSFALWKLDDAGGKPIATLNPDTPMAIGSAFKLYVLGTLMEEVKLKKRTPADVVSLRAEGRSLPSGSMQDWPVGAPVTLSTLANMMISISDNTATDTLIATLGRERIEGMLSVMGMKDPQRTLPFLCTSEMFKLKGRQGGAMATAYAALDVAGRRAMLASPAMTGAIDMGQMDSSAFTVPSHVDSVEWFASTNDLCRAMNWIRIAADSQPAESLQVLEGALAINRGLDISRDAFPWVGFKGGSEPGVLNSTYLLKAKNGAWYALSASWNDSEKVIDLQTFAAIVQRTIYVLGANAKE